MGFLRFLCNELFTDGLICQEFEAQPTLRFFSALRKQLIFLRRAPVVVGSFPDLKENQDKINQDGRNFSQEFLGGTEDFDSQRPRATHC